MKRTHECLQDHIDKSSKLLMEIVEDPGISSSLKKAILKYFESLASSLGEAIALDIKEGALNDQN